MREYYLGIDTSAYTTSLGLVDKEGRVVLNLREPLKVKENQKGLRQQEAVFQHMNNLPILINELTKTIDISKIITVAVSTKPRNLIDSYMPVFTVGKNQAFIISRLLNIEYKEFSHQEGHLGAALIREKIETEEEFIGLHISGGTTEIVEVTNGKDNLEINILGGSLDISFGQLIDRIGQELNLGFPSGAKMDELSIGGQLIDINVPINFKDVFWTNISGLENFFKNLIHLNTYNTEDIIITLFHTIGRLIEKLIENTLKTYRKEKAIITGGVAANTYIRKYLNDNFKETELKLIFPEANYSTDNGIGVAYLGKIKKGHNMEV